MKANPFPQVWTLGWSNPHKPRPDGMPEVILRLEQLGDQTHTMPTEMLEAWEEMHSYGYAVSWHRESLPSRRLPLESKQRIRRRNLWKRLLKTRPLLLADWYGEQVRAKPEHYGPYDPGEFANVEFYRTTMGALKMVQGIGGVQ